MNLVFTAKDAKDAKEAQNQLQRPQRRDATTKNPFTTEATEEPKLTAEAAGSAEKN
ncbi:MAG TPA: hypothetical protein VG759_15785 [Candidatus Angelobacter sp.]|nr:hypothetical protein [Candidatus Angelobacter sp.]